LALDDADASNGALMVVPRTNFLGDLPVESKNYLEKDKTGKTSQKHPIGMECRIPEGYEPVQLTYKRGDIIFLHGHTIHRANKNSHPERWLAGLECPSATYQSRRLNGVMNMLRTKKMSLELKNWRHVMIEWE